jgi:hypothetical protein
LRLPDTTDYPSDSAARQDANGQAIAAQIDPSHPSAEPARQDTPPDTRNRPGPDAPYYPGVKVHITPNDKGNPPGKLADAELMFTAGPLEGLKLIGFAIWERRGGTGYNVTFPARQYSVNGERRSFALLRPIVDVTAQERVRGLLLEAYAEHCKA